MSITINYPEYLQSENGTDSEFESIWDCDDDYVLATNENEAESTSARNGQKENGNGQIIGDLDGELGDDAAINPKQDGNGAINDELQAELSGVADIDPKQDGNGAINDELQAELSDVADIDPKQDGNGAINDELQPELGDVADINPKQDGNDQMNHQQSSSYHHQLFCQCFLELQYNTYQYHFLF